MVVVPVRDEDGVGIGHVLRQGVPAPQMRDPVPEQGIGEDRGAVQLDEHRGVPDIGQSVHGTIVLRARTPRISRSG